MVLSAATHEKIREEISHYPNARGALLYALHLARGEAGALGKEVFAEVGEHFGMRAGEVAEVASFYSLFNQPRAEAAKSQYDDALQEAGFNPITTEIEPAGPFYYAEGYHQQYLHKVPDGYCGLKGTGVTCSAPAR